MIIRSIYACTRPCRACPFGVIACSAFALLSSVGVPGFICVMSLHTYLGIVKDWRPARCTTLSEMRVRQGVGEYGAYDTYQVDLPVRLTVAGRGEVDAVAHRWPADLQDTRIAELYSWWLSVGMSGWKANGRIHFNTTVGAALDCWYAGHGGSLYVKLDDSDPKGTWFWLLAFAISLPVTLKMAQLFYNLMQGSVVVRDCWPGYMDGWKRLEVTDAATESWDAVGERLGTSFAALRRCLAANDGEGGGIVVAVAAGSLITLLLLLILSA
jgi:hypothetical protein